MRPDRMGREAAAGLNMFGPRMERDERIGHGGNFLIDLFELFKITYTF